MIMDKQRIPRDIDEIVVLETEEARLSLEKQAKKVEEKKFF